MKIKINRDDWIETDDLDYDQLYDLRQKVADTAIEIESQIELAKARRIETGDFASPVWFARANHALRTKRRELQSLQELLSAKRKEKKQQDRSLADHFVDVCRERLDQELLGAIFAAARDRMGVNRDGK